MRTYIDSHTHMNHKRFDSNRKGIIELSHDSGIELMINAAIDFESNFNMRKSLDKYDYIKYAVGIHPNSVGTDENVDAEWDAGLLSLLAGSDKSAKTVAIGETGLDYHRVSRDEDGDLTEDGIITLSRQFVWFRKQLKLASMLKLPIILHVRNAKTEKICEELNLEPGAPIDHTDAHREVLTILREFNENLSLETKGVVHCFSSDTISDAEEYIKLGFMIGVGGSLTYPENEKLREIIRQVPLENIVLETDCPYLLPAGIPGETAIAGKRNTPLSIPFIADYLADLKGVSVDEVADITTANAKKLFRIE